jgi:hypothetical protein
MERHSTKLWIRQGISVVCALLLAGTGAVALAQGPVAPPQGPPRAQALPPQQLDDLVAPIALYPDPLLGQVLAASTYPVELVEAQQWLQANSNLQGAQLTDAARQQSWDASVQAMVAMPDVLAKLNQDIRWATDLGNAFLAQPADVMAAVQRMRARAQQNGRLQSSPQETVTTQDQGGQQAIVIQPADPQVIYVPTYDPTYIWGPPLWGAYPPLYYPYGFGYYPGIHIGLYFGGWGGWGFGLGGFGWGWGPNWFGGGLFVNGGFFNHFGYRYGGGFGGGIGVGLRAGTAAWAHDPAHRMGVGYPNSALSSRFGAASQASRLASARSGNYHSFGANSATAGSSLRGGTAQAAGARSYQGATGSSGYQHFQAGRQAYQAPAQRSQGATQQRYNAPAGQQRYSAPAGQQRYSAPAGQRYSAPATQHYSAPATQHYSAPSYSSGGARSSSGGGASHSSGGGSHGGGGHGRR